MYVFILLLLTHFIFSQTETAVYKQALKQFTDSYNVENYKKIHSQFAEIMKKALPEQNLINFLSSVQKDAGKLKSTEFTKFNSSFAIYKSSFERATLDLHLSVDSEGKINGFRITAHVETAKLLRNKTEVILPFKGEWNVFWGGDTEKQNYHIVSQSQKHAFDFLIKDKASKTFKNEGKTNKDYYAFGKELIAPCKAEVVLAVDGIKDNNPGEMNPMFATGNTVILKTNHNEYLVFAHFKQNSIKVKEGDLVEQGQVLGLTGNSGNSSEAHLHFHIQDGEDLTKSLGVKAYFKELIVNGKMKEDYSPIQNDIIKTN